MAINILEMLTDALGDQVVSQASKYLGESESGTKSALGMLLPALLGGLAKQGSTSDGAAGLLKTLAGSDVDSGILGDLAGLFSGGTRTESLVGLGTSLVKGLFGDKVGSLVSTIASLTGLKSSSSSNLLYMAAPLVFGFIKKLVGEHNLDAAGLMRLLGEQTGFLKEKVDNRLTSALGLGSLFGEPVKRAAEAVRSTERYVRDYPVAEESASIWSKLWPWLLLLGGLLGGLALFRSCQTKEPVAVAPAPAPLPAAVRPAAPMAAALPAKVYFEVGQAVLTDTARRTIADAAAGIKNQGLTVDITGYTDKTGDVAKNMELAKQRAVAVRDALVAAGVAPARINMQPPLTIAITGTTTGSGSDAEARRVEISRAN
jgi:outer membrane protein OmpA-like peptidoglycan-associated protein